MQGILIFIIIFFLSNVGSCVNTIPQEMWLVVFQFSFPGKTPASKNSDSSNHGKVATGQERERVNKKKRLVIAMNQYVGRSGSALRCDV